MPTYKTDLSQPHVYLACRVNNREAHAAGKAHPDWEILGIYSDPHKAEGRCTQAECDHVVALPLNVDLPEETVSAEPLWWPLKKKEEDQHGTNS
jgi:hypothetical protein